MFYASGGRGGYLVCDAEGRASSCRASSVESDPGGEEGDEKKLVIFFSCLPSRGRVMDVAEPNKCRAVFMRDG